MRSIVLLLLLFGVALAELTLRDEPILGSSVTYLDGVWKLHGSNTFSLIANTATLTSIAT
jgi:hypothetical protein